MTYIKTNLINRGSIDVLYQLFHEAPSSFQYSEFCVKSISQKADIGPSHSQCSCTLQPGYSLDPLGLETVWSSEIIEIYGHNYRYRYIFRSYTCRLTIYLSSLWFRNSKFRRVLELSTKMCKTSRPSLCCVHSQRRGATQWRHSGTLLLCTPGAVRWDRDVISILCISMVVTLLPGTREVVRSIHIRSTLFSPF